jgi:hypothetical protein
MASFDGNGLVIDRLADIRTEIEDNLKSVFGPGINLDDLSPFGVIIGIMSERYSLLWEILESVYLASFPNTSFGIYLDELSAFNGVVREPATFSVVDLTFTRSTPTGTGDVTVPAGTEVTAVGSLVIWTTTIEATIDDLATTTIVQALADEVGPIGAQLNTLTEMASPPLNVDSVTNLTEAVIGSDEESDAALKLRRQTQLGRSGTSTEAGIRSALQLMDLVRAAVLVINDTDLTVDGLPPHSFEPFIGTVPGTELGNAWSLVFDADLNAGNSIAVTIDATPITGSPFLFDTDNSTTLTNISAGILAAPEISTSSSDGTDTIITTGSSATDFVLAAVVTGGSPVGVVASEIFPANEVNLNAVAQTIWDSKGAGIQTFGSIVGIATDTQGDDHSMFFSEIQDVQIFVRYTLTTDAEFDSAIAEPAIKAAVLSYAELNLTPGVDVLAYKLLCVASDVNAAGITRIICEVSDDNTFFTEDFLDIGPSQFATIADEDITFV